jgi:predicted enzyme related to lactoylglutathione lyase
MGNPAGSFIWYELMTPDPDTARTFYASVIGWTISDPDSRRTDGKDYRMIVRSDGRFAGGVLKLTADMKGARPMWLPYLSTPDVDAEVAATTADGGQVRMPALTMPGVGRIALVTDPQGVPIYVMTPTPPPGMPDPTSDVFERSTPQRVNWNELSSPDLDASKAFYARHFGFEFNETMDMGPLGPYCFIDHHGSRLGAITGRPDNSQPAAWLFYFGVPSVGAGRKAIEDGGGTVMIGPHQVPTGEWIVIAADPAGAPFGIVGPR